MTLGGAMSQKQKMNVGRRQVLVSLGAFASLAAVAGVATNAQALGKPVPPTDEPTSQPEEVVAAAKLPDSPLGKTLPHGAKLGSWTIERVLPVTLGAIPVVMRTAAGDRFQVDILARDFAEGSAQGVANTSKLSLFIANNGSGACATSEEQGLGAMLLGRYLAMCEARGMKSPKLLTHAVRNSRYPRGNFMA